MDFLLPPNVAQTRDQIRDFVHKHILPVEADPSTRDAHENIGELPLARLREQVRAAGLWAPAMPLERGGLGILSPYVRYLVRRSVAMRYYLLRYPDLKLSRRLLSI